MQYKQSKVYPSSVYNEIIALERHEFKKDLGSIYQGDSEIKVIYAKQDDEIIAYITYKELDDSIDIYMLMVTSEYRKQGIASDLLDNLYYKNIILEVRESNSSAIKFYKKHEFKQIRTIKNYYENNEAGLVMYKEL